MKTPKTPRSDQHTWAADLFGDAAESDPHAPSTANIVLDNLATDDPVGDLHETGTLSFGECLRAARTSRGLELASCSQSLHLSTRVLGKLESDDYSGIDSPVYLRSYLIKYAAFLGLSRDAVDAHLAQLPSQPEMLVSTGGIPRSRYLLERYATAATYVVLTAVIVVPIVWFGLKGGLDREVARLAPLDSSPVAIKSPASHNGAGKPGSNAARHVAADPASSQQPLQASMAPFSALDKMAAEGSADAVPAMDGGGDHSITLNLPAASWVEITANDGQRLEYGLLPAGTRKTYHSSEPLDISIGNADGAAVTIDGSPVDLTRFRHAKVARFQLRVADGTASAESR